MLSLLGTAETSGAIGIAIRRWRRQTEATDFGQPTAAVTRWRVTALPSSPLPVPGIGRARWQLELIRVRAGESADSYVQPQLGLAPTEVTRPRVFGKESMEPVAAAGRSPYSSTAEARAHQLGCRCAPLTSPSPAWMMAMPLSAIKPPSLAGMAVGP